MTPALPDDSLLLLGRDHADFGRIEVRSLADTGTTAAISVGADRSSPSMASKGRTTEPNEDALFVVDDGRRVLVVVADAHFGIEASHDLMWAFADRTGILPRTPDELAELLRSIDAPGPPTPSRTTCTVCLVDRGRGRAFGVSFGDSSVVTVGTEAVVRRTLPDSRYVDPRAERPLDPAGTRAFQFEFGPEDLVVAFTDGIDQCHYRSPRTSIGPRHLARLFVETGPDPRRFAAELAALALAGVDGNPGGQDNLAVVAVSGR